MEWNTYLVLKTCIEKARNGEITVSVFDLTYETGFEYPQLKDMLDELVTQNELEVIDVKTYKFIGDANRPLVEVKEDFSQEDEDEYEERMRQIREIILEADARNKEKEEDDEDDEDEPEIEVDDDEDEEEEEDDLAGITVDKSDDSLEDEVFTDVDMDEDELRYNVLKVGIRNGLISVPVILRTFPFVGYAKANRLMDWMKGEGYAKSIAGPTFSPCRMTVTLEELDRIFRKTNVLITDRLLEKTSRKAAIQNLAAVLSRIAQKKWGEEVTADKVPSSSLWNYKEFDDAVLDRLERLIRSDLKMARRGAIKKAETYLEAVRDTHDSKMVQVYERLVYELKVVSDKTYNVIRNRMREGA